MRAIGGIIAGLVADIIVTILVGIVGLRSTFTVPAHVHPLANEQVYILSGDWEEEGQVHGPGTFFYAPRGERHGPHVARTEVVSLTHFDGPLTVA